MKAKEDFFVSWKPVENIHQDHNSGIPLYSFYHKAHRPALFRFSLWWWKILPPQRKWKKWSGHVRLHRNLHKNDTKQQQEPL